MSQPNETPSPDPFTIESARQCVEILFEAIPKSRRVQYLGELNEVLVVLGKSTLKEQ